MRDLVLGLQVIYQILEAFVLDELVRLKILRDHTGDEHGRLLLSTLRQEGFSLGHA